VIDALQPDQEALGVELREAAEQFAAKGLRVLAVARTDGSELGEGRAPRIEPLGLIGLADPPRDSAREAIARARAAGVETVMITGDHPVTAQAIALELNLIGPDDDPATRARRVRA